MGLVTLSEIHEDCEIASGQSRLGFVARRILMPNFKTILKSLLTFRAFWMMQTACVLILKLGDGYPGVCHINLYLFVCLKY